MLKKYSNHFDHLAHIIPAMKTGKLLDIGSGKGKFLLQAARRGAKAYGLELNPENVAKAKSLAEKENLSINIVQGEGEKLPFEPGQFDFINMAELIEHVESPEQLLTEVRRVLKKGGHAYMSVPTRFSLKDPHFHLYFVNWLPRSMVHRVIGLLGKHKVYDGSSGRQRLDRMHYYTYAQLSKLVKRVNLTFFDLREYRIKTEIKGFLKYPALAAYYCVRGWLFTTYHIILVKNEWS